MHVIAVRQASGTVVLEVGEAIAFDPKNGGWISLRQGMHTSGWPLGQIESCKLVGPNEYIPMPDEEKEQAVKDWLDNRIAEREGAGMLSDVYDEREKLIDVRGLIK